MSVSPDEPVDHKHVVAFLARKSALPIDEVTQLYEHEWAALQASARIKSFIPILTVRRVRELLRKRSNKTPKPPSQRNAPISG